jgi:hypothetical protein
VDLLYGGTADLANRSEGGSEQVVAEISFVSSPKMIAGANCHHATRRAPDHSYLACQLLGVRPGQIRKGATQVVVG